MGARKALLGNLGRRRGRDMGL